MYTSTVHGRSAANAASEGTSGRPPRASTHAMPPPSRRETASLRPWRAIDEGGADEGVSGADAGAADAGGGVVWPLGSGPPGAWGLGAASRFMRGPVVANRTSA